MSMIAINKLVFDPASLSESANVGAYLRGSDGTLLTQTGGALDVNVTNASLVVTATDLDIRNLSASQDNVAISDGTDTLAVNTDGSINTKAAGASSAAYGATSVGTSAVNIIASPLTNRIQVMFQNLGNKEVYLGSDNAVTTSNGILLAPGMGTVLDLAAGVSVYGISTAASQSVRYFELAA